MASWLAYALTDEGSLAKRGALVSFSVLASFAPLQRGREILSLRANLGSMGEKSSLLGDR